MDNTNNGGSLLGNRPPGIAPFGSNWNSRTFAAMLGLVQFSLLVCFNIITKHADWSEDKKNENVQLYNYLSGVMMMMFVGFGYLMTFLRWYGLGAVGFTMLITALGAQISLLAEPLFTADSWSYHQVEIGLPELLNAMFCVAACLISFGGLIGKVGPTQILILVCLEVVFYSANKVLILTRWLDIVDCGGTIIIHQFGAYFGLAASLVLGAPTAPAKEKSSIVSDITSLIGTTVLWVYWPSFVAGGLPYGTPEAELALTNTILALLGSTVATFIASVAFSKGSIGPVDIQNAALAGGVSIGAVANLDITPFGAVLIGCIAGLVSTAGYRYIQEFLLEKIKLHDTCGIHNLHGMPSLVGGLASVIVPHLISDAVNPDTGNSGTQLAGMGLTLVTSIIAGGFTGSVMKRYSDDSEMGDDSAYWEVADEF